MITDNGLDIHLSEDMVEAIRRRRQGVSATEIRGIVCRWCGMLNAGKAELQKAFTDEEIAAIIKAVSEQARADGLKTRELWEMGAARIAAIAGIKHEELYDRCLGLSELAAMYIKEMVCGATVMHAGYGGRPKVR